jgi:hypothetical protein
MLETLPIGVIVFPGSGICENLTVKAKTFGIPHAVYRGRVSALFRLLPPVMIGATQLHRHGLSRTQSAMMFTTNRSVTRQHRPAIAERYRPASIILDIGDRLATSGTVGRVGLWKVPVRPIEVVCRREIDMSSRAQNRNETPSADPPCAKRHHPAS